MVNTRAHCRYCGSDDVDTYRALNGIIVYECDACWRIWNNSQLPKIQDGINLEEVQAERKFTKVVPGIVISSLQLIDRVCWWK